MILDFKTIIFYFASDFQQHVFEYNRFAINKSFCVYCNTSKRESVVFYLFTCKHEKGQFAIPVEEEQEE